MTPPPDGYSTLSGLAPPVNAPAHVEQAEAGLHAPAAPPAAPVLNSANAEASAPSSISPTSAHLPAGTVPPADKTDPDQHALHRDPPDSAAPAPKDGPEVVHPTDTFPLRADVEHAPTLDPAEIQIPTNLLETAEASITDALASAAGFVDATEAALDQAVTKATAPDPNDLDPNLAPFRQGDPQSVLPRITGTQMQAAPDANAAHPTGAKAALKKNLADGLVGLEADRLHWQANGDGEEDEEKGGMDGEEEELVPGLENDKLFAMMRRLNTQVKHVLSPPTKLPQGEPDLRRTTLKTVPFDVDTLRSNAERVYATAGVWGIYSFREVERLMNWSDRRRTASFAAAYFLAWWFKLVLPTFLCFTAVMMVFEPARGYLFPPVRPNGLGPLSEHPTKAEQIEQHAWEFTNVLQRFATAVAKGGPPGKGSKGNAKVGRKHASPGPDSSSDESEDEDQFGVVDLVVQGAEVGLEEQAREMRREGVGKRERGREMKARRRRARAKRDALVGRMGKTAQDGLGDAADWLELFANAFSPPRPYPKTHAREKVAGLAVVPLALAIALVPLDVFAQAASFAFGVGFFCQPMLFALGRRIAHRVPDWQDKIDPRNSLLSRVPTNAQFILHCLRVKEAQQDPLPQPPPPPEPDHVKDQANDHNARSNADDPDFDDRHAGQALLDRHIADSRREAHEKGEGKKGMMSSLRSAVRKAAPFKTDITAKEVLSKAAGKVDHAVYQSKAKDDGRADSYPAKLAGTSGHLVLERRPGREPILSFIPVSSPTDNRDVRGSVEDLVELKKLAMSNKRTALGLVGGVPLEGAGLEVRFKPRKLRRMDNIGKGEGVDKYDETFEGEKHLFEHVGRRDQLFARLISMGSQKLETL